MIVLLIISSLTTIAVFATRMSRENAYYSRAALETTEIAKSLLLYLQDNGSYPADANRDLPPGLEAYLPAGDWPNGPWPGSVYDWDNWNDPSNPGQKIYQISIRFCPIGGPLGACQFPKTSWAADFGVNSSVYYCLSGACRAHAGEPVGYPGKCLNC